MTFKIITDSTSDLSEEWAKKNDVLILGLTIEIEGRNYETTGAKKISSQELIKKMSEAHTPKTSQVSIGKFFEYFLKIVETGEDILCITLSSVLSGTYQSAVMAKEMVLEKYPKAKINIIDSFTASGGEGYLVVKANQLKREGLNLKETTTEIEQIQKKIHTYFLVDDLKHLMRGGRLSKTSALIGSIVNIKPIITISENGTLIAHSKVRGKKKAIQTLIDLANITQPYEKIVLAYNGPLEDIKAIINTLKTEDNKIDIMVVELGPVISTHVGPNTIALFRI